MATKSKKTTTTTVSSSNPTTSIEIASGTGQQQQQPQQQQQQSTTTTTSITTSSTRSGTPIRRSQTPTRPVSPGRLSRIQEKTELQNLNDRLAAYIERVRSLETENSKLRIQIQKSMESREVHTIKTLYEVELNDTRKTLDSIAKEKAQLELELSRLREELKVAESKLAKKLNEANNLEKRNQALDLKIEELNSKISQLLNERKRLENEIRVLTEENKNLEGRLKSLQKQLEEETILRVDLENRNQSLNEELAFQRQLYQNEMEEVRRKTYESKEIHTEELKAQYEERLKYELDELRANMDDMIRINRRDLEERYELRIGLLQEEMAKKNLELNAAANKIKQLNSSYTMYDTELETMKNENMSMKKRIEDMNKLLSQERDWNKIKMNEKEKEIEEIRRELQRITDDYNDLLDDKIKLDAELEVYRKLLEGEETRLNISLSSMGSGSGSGGNATSGGGGGGFFSSSSSQAISSSSGRTFIPRGVKRKRIALQDQESVVDYVVNASSVGEIEISDHDVDGKYVKLFNKSDKEISLSGWYLLRRADDLETRYKFHRSVVIKPQATITIWSSDAGTQIHNPPSDIVMKSQTWFTADTMSTTLYNNNNEEIATRKTEKRITSSFHRLSSGYPNHENNADNQNCAIM